jgi:hypothetical protein
MLYGLDAGTGALAGRVVAERGPVVGANVVALSLGHAGPFTTAVTGPDGAFRLEGLSPGEHVLWVEPTAVGVDPATQRPACADGLPARTPVSQAGRLRRFDVGAGVELDLGDLVLACTPDGGADVGLPPATLGGDASVAFEATPGVPQAIRLEGLTGPLQVTAIGWSLWSPVELDLEVLDVVGRPLDTRAGAASPNLGYGDDQVRFEAPRDGVAQLVIHGARLTSQSFPLGGLLDAQPFVVLLVGPEAPTDPCSPRGAPRPRALQEGDPTRRDVQAVASTIEPSACGCRHARTGALVPVVLAAALGRRRTGVPAR